jgi:hypothetical protein
MISIHEDYIDGKVCDGAQDDVHIDTARSHTEFGAPA